MQPDLHDRRVTRLRITTAGRNQLQRLIAARLTGAAALFEVLTATERRQLAKLLARIQAAAGRTDAGPPSSPE